ncbi:MAG: two-component regulator propeller domain-containing protein [Pseudomonadota bacterium]
MASLPHQYPTKDNTWLRNITTCIVLLGIVLFSHAVAASALRLADQREVIFEYIDTRDGLSASAVTSVAQDTEGFIWVGSQEGLNRYDGFDIDNYLHQANDEASLSNSWVWDILRDSSGRLWIGTVRGLNRYDVSQDAFERISFRPFGEPADARKLFEDSRGVLWIGTEDGVSRRLPDGTFEHFRHSAFDPSTVGPGRVLTITEGPEGFIWVGTSQGGLCRFDETTGTFLHYVEPGLGDVNVRDLLYVDGELWVATEGDGVSILNVESGTLRRIREADGVGLGSDEVRALLLDAEGSIWLGTSRGLNLWQPSSNRFARYMSDPTDVLSISDNNIFDLFQDRGGVIWSANFKGLNKWNGNIVTFPRYSRDATTPMAGNTITTFAENAEGDLWIGSFEGLSHWDAQTGEFNDRSAEFGLADGGVMALQYYEGDLWVAIYKAGIRVIRPDGTVVPYRAGGATGDLTSDTVTGFYVDPNNRLWVQTFEGVNRYVGEGQFELLASASSGEMDFEDLIVLEITSTVDGRLWVGTQNLGLYVFSDLEGRVHFENYSHRDRYATSLSSNSVTSLIERDGDMWVGTLDGLNRLNEATGTFEHFKTEHGLAGNAVYGTLVDSEGRLWISGGRGLSVLDPDTRDVTTYDSEQGLQSEDFNSGAVLKMSDGTFVFGGTSGFNAFDPMSIRSNTHVPPVVITGFQKFNEDFKLPQPIYSTKQIDLEFTDSVIGFEFAAIDYTAPDKNRFQYKLEPFDDTWIDAVTNSRTYTNLPADTYTFRVRAANSSGVWNEEGASVTVVKPPAPYATWWAYTIYAALLVALMYYVKTAYTGKLQREAEKRYNDRLQLYISSMEEATDCVLIADADKKVMFANNSTPAILGVGSTEAHEEPMLSLLFRDDRDADIALEGLKREGRWHGEVTHEDDQKVLTTEVTIAAVKDDDGIDSAFVSIARDVTHRKQVENELSEYRRNLESKVALRTQRLNSEIAENKAVTHQLANSLKEKELLLKEVHHRVKNNMQVISSLLNIQAETIADDTFSNLLGESQQRIKSMSLIHENLYQSDNLLEIDFEDYINMLSNSLCRFYTIPGVSIHLDIQVEDVSLDLETAVPCGLIINELISNSLKHGFTNHEGTGIISVSFVNAGCRYVLKVSDNGVGLPMDFDPDSGASMGMEIVSILTQQLDGRLQADGDDGAHFEISFPIKQKELTDHVEQITASR